MKTQPGHRSAGTGMVCVGGGGGGAGPLQVGNSGWTCQISHGYTIAQTLKTPKEVSVMFHQKLFFWNGDLLGHHESLEEPSQKVRQFDLQNFPNGLKHV